MKVENLLGEILLEREWRVRELNIYLSIPHRYSNLLFQNIKSSYLNMCIPMIYAHWEGFVVQSVSLVYQYLNLLSIKHQDIHKNLAVVSLSPLMHKLSGNCSRDKEREFYNAFIEQYSEEVYIDYKTQSIAQSNLNFRQITKILDDLGLDNKFLYPYESSIEKLLNYRNRIAHGENSIIVEESDLIFFVSQITELFDLLILRIKDYLMNKEYLIADHLV